VLALIRAELLGRVAMWRQSIGWRRVCRELGCSVCGRGDGSLASWAAGVFFSGCLWMRELVVNVVERVKELTRPRETLAACSEMRFVFMFLVLTAACLAAEAREVEVTADGALVAAHEQNSTLESAALLEAGSSARWSVKLPSCPTDLNICCSFFQTWDWGTWDQCGTQVLNVGKALVKKALEILDYLTDAQKLTNWLCKSGFVRKFWQLYDWGTRVGKSQSYLAGRLHESLVVEDSTISRGDSVRQRACGCGVCGVFGVQLCGCVLVGCSYCGYGGVREPRGGAVQGGDGDCSPHPRDSEDPWLLQLGLDQMGLEGLDGRCVWNGLRSHEHLEED
jgi:hypothetical protein